MQLQNLTEEPDVKDEILKSYLSFTRKISSVQPHNVETVGGAGTRLVGYASVELLHGVIGLAGELLELAEKVELKQNMTTIEEIVREAGNPQLGAMAYCLRPSVEEITEEIGDILWYLARICDVTDVDTEWVFSENFNWIRRGASPRPGLHVPNTLTRGMAPHSRLRFAAERILDWYKRYVFYGHDPDGELTNVLDLVTYVTCLEYYSSGTNATIAELLESNVRKLQKRYPDAVWDQDNAVNRDTNAELGAIASTPQETTE